MFERTIERLVEREHSHWDIGDALVAEITSSTDWDDLAQAVTARGLEYKISTLRAYHRVAKAFPQDERVPGVSFAAHQAALTAGDAHDARVAIDRAKANSGAATRATVLAEVRVMKGRTQTAISGAVSAWGDLRRGVERLLATDPAEIESLIVMDDKYAAQAAALSQDLAKVAMLISDAAREAERRVARHRAKQAQVRAAQAPKARPESTKASAPVQATPAAAKPKLGRLGKGRGEA